MPCCFPNVAEPGTRKVGDSRRSVLFLFLPTAPSAQTRTVLTQGTVGAACTATDCEPGFVLDIDVDATRLRARTPIPKARYRSFGPAVTADSRFADNARVGDD
jgi:hypothetical protein